MLITISMLYVILWCGVQMVSSSEGPRIFHTLPVCCGLRLWTYRIKLKWNDFTPTFFLLVPMESQYLMGPSLTLTPEMKLRQLSWGSGSAITTNSWSKSEELFFGFTAQQAATHFRWYVWDSLPSRCVTCCGFWPKVRPNSFEYDEDILRWEWEWFCLHWALAFGLSLYDVSRHSAAAVGILRTFRAAFTEPAYADIYPSQRYQLLF